MEQVTKLSNKNDLFYSQAELLNFALHKYKVDVYEIVEPEDKEDKHIYAIVKEINKDTLENLKNCGFSFYCIDPYLMTKDKDSFSALWIQFYERFN